jgi:hypothetical protein
MGTWSATVECDGTEYGLLFDSVTMRPLALPLFHGGIDEAEAFERFALRSGVPDLRALSAAELEGLFARFVVEGPGEDEDEEEDEPLFTDAQPRGEVSR